MFFGGRREKYEGFCFVRGECDKEYTAQKSNDHIRRGNTNNIYLLEIKSLYTKIISSLPRNFTLTTNNGSGEFNTILLRDTCQTISQFLKENPNATQFHIDVDDKDDLISKFEKLYKGDHISFIEDELPISKKITTSLILKNCPNYMKSENLSSDESMNRRLGLESGLEIDPRSFIRYIQSDKHKTFKIVTKHAEYECNYITIFTSDVLCDFVTKNPKADKYEFDYVDENGEFEQIYDFFNFNPIEINVRNMDTLKEIAEGLKIELIIPKIDQFITNYEKFAEKIDEQQHKAETIEELFGWLYNIKSLTVESVKSSILNSEWIIEEDDVIELAAFVLQTIGSSCELHSYLIDLLISLDKEANETNKLEILLPFVIKQIMFTFGENISSCSFIYNLYKKGALPKEKLLNKIKNIFDNYNNDSRDQRRNCLANLDVINNLHVWFLPELIELNITTKLDEIANREEHNLRLIKGSRDEDVFSKFIRFYYPDKIELYTKMRDSGEPDDELTKALQKDDVDKAQSIITQTNIDINNFIVPFNIFDNIFLLNGRIKLINYAAAFGSVSCFKYLKLSHSEIDDITFIYAIYGGNTEIIQIVDQNIGNKESKPQEKKSFSLSLYLDTISQAISKHKNDIFDWVLEQKFSQNAQKIANSILQKSVDNGNAHAFIEVADKYVTNYDFQELFETACAKGFYKLATLISDISDKKADPQRGFDHFSKISRRRETKFSNKFASFGNLSIYKLGISDNIINDQYISSLFTCIEKDYKSIFNYFFDEIVKNDTSKLTSGLLFEIATKAIECKSNYYFNQLIDKIKEIKPGLLKNFNRYMKLLLDSCDKSNVDVIKSVVNLMKGTNKKYDITDSFVSAARNGLTEICQSLINDDYFIIDISSFLNDTDSLGKLKKDIFIIILDNSSPGLRESFLSISLDPAIINKNKELVEYLVEQKVSSNNALINAIQTNDIEIVDIILKYNSTPYFINNKSRNGTPLLIATNMDNLELVKRLLAIPGIDPNLYDNDDKTPLISSIIHFNLDIMNEILDFYGEKIQEQTWQLDKAIRMTLSMLSAQKGPNSSSGTTWVMISNKQSLRQRNPEIQMTERKKQLLMILNRILQIKNIDPNLHGGEHTLLSYACEANEVNIVQMLLETDKIDVNAYAPRSGNTPLMISIINNNLDIAKLLIRDKRTNINARNYNGETALTFAVDGKMEDIVSELIKNEKFDPVESSLNYAFYKSSSPISNLLFTVPSLDVNCKVNNSANQNSRNTSIPRPNRRKMDQIVYLTPLSKAINDNDSEKIKLILQHPTFDKVKSQIVQSIFELVYEDKDELFKILIETIDNDVNIMNYSKTTLLDAAISYSSVKIVDEILKNEKFDTTKNNILNSFKYFLICCNFSDDIANSILEFDAKNTHLIDFHGSSYFFIFDNFSNINGKIEFLLDHGADPNVPNENGVYPLAYAIYINHRSYVSALLESNKNDLTKHITAESKKVGFLSNGISDFKEKVNFTAKYTTYLHLAAKSSESIIKEFLKLDSININELDEQGNTPLMYAVANKCHDVIQALFNFEGQELDYLHVNNDGKNALTMLKCSNEVKQDIHDKEQFKEALLNCIRENRENKSKFKFGFNINNKRDENNSKSEDTDNKPKEEKLDTEQLDKEKKSNQQQQEEKNSGSDEKSASSVPKRPAFGSKQIGLKANQQQQEAKDSESGEKSPSFVPKKPTFSFKQIGLKTNQQQQEAKDSESGEKSQSSVPKKSTFSFKQIGLKTNQQQQEAKDSESGEKSQSSVPNKPTFSFKQIGLKPNQQQQEAKDSESGEKSPSSVPKSQHLD